MGLNTRVNKSKDLISLFNVTKNCWIKCELMNNDSLRDYETLMGVSVLQYKYALKISGSWLVDVRDKIKVGNYTYQVASIQTTIDNIQEARFRNDLENFTGYRVILLE